MRSLYIWICSSFLFFLSLFSSHAQAHELHHGHHHKHKHAHKRHKARIQHKRHHHRQIHHRHHKRHHSAKQKHLRHHVSHPFTQVGEASFYGYHDGFAGRRTADGSVFHPMAATVAHRTLPLGSMVRITNLETGRTQVAKVTDRGPFYGNRIVDVSYGIAKRLGMVQDGTCRVKIERMI